MTLAECSCRAAFCQGGLAGTSYLDNLDKRATVAQQSADVVFDREVDRIYLSTPDAMVLSEGTRTVRVQKRGLPDSVVWNPWVDKAKSLADFGADTPNSAAASRLRVFLRQSRRMRRVELFLVPIGAGDDEYKEMVCIEPAAIAKAVRVEAGQSWEGGQVLSAERREA